MEDGSNGNGNGRWLTAAEILAAKDLKIEPVEVPEWGGTLGVRSLNALEAEDFGETPKKAALLRLVELCACDKDGTRLFTEPGDIQALAEKNWGVILRLHQAAAELNGLTPDAQVAVKNA